MGTGMVLRDPFVSIGGSDISDYITQVEGVGNTFENVGMESGGDEAKWGKPGMGAWAARVTCKQDFDDNGLDEIMWAINGSETPSAVIIRPKRAVKGANNPEFTGNGIVCDYAGLSGTIGQRANATFTIECGDGNLLDRAIS